MFLFSLIQTSKLSPEKFFTKISKYYQFACESQAVILTLDHISIIPLVSVFLLLTEQSFFQIFGDPATRFGQRSVTFDAAYGNYFVQSPEIVIGNKFLVDASVVEQEKFIELLEIREGSSIQRRDFVAV